MEHEASIGLEDGTVFLREHQAAWAQLFQAEAARIGQVLRSAGIKCRVEHVGSTAVPDLRAKPVIDIAVGLSALKVGEQAAGLLGGLGYRNLGTEVVTHHHVLLRGSPLRYTVHVLRHGGARWDDLLAFRELLRLNRQACETYEARKIELANRHATARAEYRRAKSPVIAVLKTSHKIECSLGNSLSVRPASTADVPDISGIYNAAVAQRFCVGVDDFEGVQERARWLRRQQRHNLPVWVLESAEGVIGWAALTRYDPAPAFEGTREVSLFLAPHAQGKGNGSQFLAWVIAYARIHGLRTLVGTCFSWNTPTLRINTKSGMKEWGRVPGAAWKHGRPGDLVTMGVSFVGADGEPPAC